ncbi:SemiSWEET transporter [Couchioplanes caeruleus subsp. azureus]|uniref:SemiSWEET transporter n=1 Tax=Couchioplanes caeruleus TaxID=56438 RepID=UPI00361437B7
MLTTALLGWLGAALSMTLPWPQVWRSCVQRRTGGLNATSCWMGAAMPAGWISYGLLTGETVQVVTNTVTGTAGLAVLVVVLARHGELRRGRTLVLSAAGAAGVLATALGCAAVALLTDATGARLAVLLGGVLTVAAVLSSIPQPLSLLRDRTQDVSGLSPLRWRLAALTCACWMTYGLAAAQPAVWLSASAGLAGALTVCWVLLTAGRPVPAAGGVAPVARAARGVAPVAQAVQGLAPVARAARGVAPVGRAARGTARVVRPATGTAVTAVLARTAPAGPARPAPARAVRPAAAVARSARPVSGPGRPGFARAGRPVPERVAGRAAVRAALG